MKDRDIAVVVSNANKDVSAIETIDAIKMRDLLMCLYNGITEIGSQHKKNN